MNIPEAAVEAAVEAHCEGTMRAALEAAAPFMLAGVIALADIWEERGESDMAFSKTIPDEHIAMDILTSGAQMVENARHIRNAIATDLENPGE
jgi:hypothetical protein